MPKQARLRPQAETDLVEATQFYAQEGGPGLAERLFDAALAALQPIERMPAMGSSRLGQLCEIPGLRSWSLANFPLQWLYFEAADHLDVVRLLGDRQDIAAILTQSD
jgi:toxin ParE1/3/4